MMMKAIPLALSSLFLVCARAQDQQQPPPCDVCVGGAFDASLSFGGIPCSDWHGFASTTTPDGEEACYLHRTSGAHFCGCASDQQFDTCYLCGDANSNEYANLGLALPDSPDGGGLTCKDILEMPDTDDGITCPLIQEKYQKWCGCPNAADDAEPPCPFCEGGGEPNPALEFPFADGGQSCAALNDWYKVQTANACPKIRQADSLTYLIDMQAYCECPGREAPKICSDVYCPSGTGIPAANLSKVLDENTGITCGDSSYLLEMIQSQANCDLLLSTADQCCKTASEVFVATATTSAAATTILMASVKSLLVVVVLGLAL
ncbi:expressed unknown protein [Seminavis robusta]|uniref:Uncharacterized protein n=1 Tax=Seminavis robusta TaxID=568900 RepID=A0A9N8DY54_9STRA|nr:expressed unknown protein [Seminavis robusta]|eukprot:Sro334_g119940.1 n/a (319) ;mRNA; r:72892-73848